MRLTLAACASLALLASANLAFAQSEGDKIPPENARKLSEIVGKIEGRPDFRYLDSVDWDEDGYYDITYHTADKAKVEIKIDAVSGEPRD